jgi:hypothetical protein
VKRRLLSWDLERPRRPGFTMRLFSMAFKKMIRSIEEEPGDNPKRSETVFVVPPEGGTTNTVSLRSRLILNHPLSRAVIGKSRLS